MQRLFSTLLLAVATMLVGNAYSQTQQTPPAKKPTTPAKSQPATTTKAKAATASKPTTPLTTKKDKFSYALGMSQGTGMATNFHKLGVEYNQELILKGIKDG